MKKLIMIAGLAALAACNKAETPAPDAQASQDVAAVSTPATAPVMAADGKDPVGRFRITSADGKVTEEEVKADGTYVTTVNGKVVESGKWAQKAPETYCYTKDGGTEVCNTEGVDAKGVWTTKSPDGKTATVVRVES